MRETKPPPPNLARVMNTARPSPGFDAPVPGYSAPFFYRWNLTLDEVSWVGHRDGVLGYAEREMPRSRLSWLSLIHPEDRAAAERTLASFLANRGTVRLEYRLRAKDEACGLVADDAAFLGDDTVIGTIRLSTVTDLTESKREERDLVKFFDLSLDLFCIANMEGFFLRVNSNFSRVLGHAEEELLSHPFLDFVHPADRPATLAEVARLASGLPVVQFRNRYRDCHDEYHWLEWVARSTPEEGMIYGAARDITDRIRMEKELLAREERERAILDNTTAVIYVKGVDGRYQFVNKRHADLFSLNQTSVIGKTSHDLFPKKVADVLARNDRQVLETRETTSNQEIIPHADGNHSYVSVKFPLFDGDGQVSAVAGISTDITDQLRAREAEEQMRVANVFQQKLYPTKPPSVSGLDVAGWALPISQVCGDYFDYILRDERRLAVSLGDVSGHGFGPALQMVEVRATIRILLRDSARLHEVVEELNRMLCVDLPESSFVSLFLAEVDAEKHELHYVGAGHQALLFGLNGATTVLDSTGPLLGIDDTASFVGPSSIPIEAGNLLVLFTDGLTEAMNLRGEQFGLRRLVAMVEANRDETSHAILQRLFAAIYDFAKGRTLQDDMTAVAVKIVG